MTISNGDLELLVKAENYIEDEKIKSQLHNLTEKLMIRKDKRNERNRVQIAEKRKDNKYYGRSKLEIARYERVKERKLKRNELL